MSGAPRDIQELLERVRQGALHELTPAEVERLAAATETTPAVADQLAALPAEPPANWPAPSPPTAEAWDAMWRNVERGAESGAEESNTGPRLQLDSHTSVPLDSRSRDVLNVRSMRRSRWFTRAPVLAAAAAIVLMVGVWRLYTPPAVAPQQLTPDRDAAFLDVSTSGNDTAVVMLSNDDDKFPVLWIVEDTGDRG